VVFGDDLMSRKYRRGKSHDLPFIHNVRPAVGLADPPRRTALIMTAGVLIVFAALLLLVFRG
jgi:hypothetical protein